MLFTENHWQTEETMKKYANHLWLSFPGKVIGLLFDCAPSHSKGLVKWINEENEVLDTKIIAEFIDECLTSIYQPCDMMINKPLKGKVRSRYYKHIRGLSSEPGEKLVISREVLMKFIVSSFNEINDEQMHDRSIAESFNKCGVNPYSRDNDLESFKRHLDSLNKVKGYKLLIQTNHYEKFKASLECIYIKNEASFFLQKCSYLISTFVRIPWHRLRNELEGVCLDFVRIVKFLSKYF